MWKDGDRIILEPAPKDSCPESYWDELDELGTLLGDEPISAVFLDLD